mgnify:CR=1 FL=1|tara:strand:+ start:150 stop:335 length:186 start_codon:yes stop_codon:yes gene_type:complete
MKRYFLFQSYNYYPSGGMDDFTNDFDTIQECHNEISYDNFDWSQIYDTYTKSFVYEGTNVS